MRIIKNYIGGEFVESESRETLPNFEPATGKIYSEVCNSNESDVEAAVRAAASAFPAWAGASLETRATHLNRIADLLESRIEEIARVESIDNGKPLTLARSVDIPRAVSNFRFFAGAAQHFASEAHSTSTDIVNITQRDPLGVVGCISPWNLPLYLLTWKIAPALAAGNCVVAKPSELTPATAAVLAEIASDAGLPPGVLNIVHGLGRRAGAAICTHPEVKAVSFTGGTATGAEIAKVSAPQFKKLSLELGGKNPNIIFSDCNFDEMLENTMRSSFSNQGQICLCGSRIYVERPIYDRFLQEFSKRAEALRPGDPLLTDTRQGALVSEGHMHKVLQCIQVARDEGGNILCGGQRSFVEGRCKDGWFVAPTIVTGLETSARTNQEEIFGPVVTVMPFESREEVIEEANATPYGLAASIWTSDLNKAHYVGSRLKSGIVWVNCWMIRDLRTPFGGMKNSGVGREGGFEALRFFTEPRNLCISVK